MLMLLLILLLLLHTAPRLHTSNSMYEGVHGEKQAQKV
jgi:hypothetical protein